MHKTIAIDALRAGKHVLCEKPAARIYSEALEMQKVQHETGKILNIGVVNRFATSVNEVRRRIMSGELGEVYHVFVNFRCHRSIPGIGGAFTTKAISGGGVLIDWGVHRIDLVMYCLGDPQPLAVCGKAFSKLGCDIPNYLYRGMWSEETRNVNGTYDVDDSVTAFIRTEGPIISLEGAMGAEHRARRELHRLHRNRRRHPSCLRRRLLGIQGRIEDLHLRRGKVRPRRYVPERDSELYSQREDR